MSIYANIQFNENQTTKLDSFKARILELEFCRKLSQIRQLIQDEKLPTCYIIAARSEKSDKQVTCLAEYLLSIKIPVYCQASGQGVNYHIPDFCRQIKSVDKVILVMTPELQEQLENNQKEIANNAYQPQRNKNDLSLSSVGYEMFHLEERIKADAIAEWLIPMQSAGKLPSWVPVISPLNLGASWPDYDSIFYLLERLLPKYKDKIEEIRRSFAKTPMPDREEESQKLIDAFFSYETSRVEEANAFLRELLQDYMRRAGEKYTSSSENNNNESSKKKFNWDAFTEKLREHYSQYKDLPVMFSDESLAIEDSRINLAVFPYKRDEAEATNESNQSSKETELLDQIIDPFFFENNQVDQKGSVLVQNIFKTEQKLVSKIFIEAYAGMGKSMLCRYIVYLWSKQKLFPEYRAVFWISLRKLRSYSKKGMNIANIIRCECLPLELAVKCTDNDINALLQNLDGQILWIFDDYDSVAECEAASPMGKLLSSLLEKSPRILTSRPGFYKSGVDERHLMISGFTDVDISTYIHHFYDKLGTSDQQSALDRLIKQSPNLRSMARTPINLELLCRSYLDQPQACSAMLTVSDFYQTIINTLSKRYLMRCGEHLNPSNNWQHQKVKPLLNALAAMAWQGTRYHRAIITPKMYNRIIDKMELNKKKNPNQWRELFYYFGLLECIYNGKSRQESHYFIHPTFQACLVAYYLVEGLKAAPETDRYRQAVNFIRFNKYQLRHKQIFSFAAGWLKNDENTLKTYWKLIREEPRDLIGLYAIDLEMCCLNEAGAPKTLMASWLPDLMAWCNKYWFNRQEENDWEETRPIVASLSDYFSKNFLVSNYCLRENESSEILSNCKVLEDSLCDNEKSIRVHAAEKLSFYAKAFPSQSSVIVGWLLKASSHQDLNICTETMAALGQLASIIPAVAPSVVRELYSNYKKWPNLKVGQVAMVTLIQWLKVNSSIDTDKFIEELRKVFDVNAISVLAHIAPLAAHSHIEPIIDQLLEKIDEGKYGWETIAALGHWIKKMSLVFEAEKVPKKAEFIYDVLLDILNTSSDSKVRAMVVFALSQLVQVNLSFSDAVFEKLHTIRLNDGHEIVRMQVVLAALRLTSIQPLLGKCVDLLERESAEDPSRSIKIKAIQMLWQKWKIKKVDNIPSLFDKYDVTDKNLDDFTVFSALNQLVTEIPSYSDDLVKEKNNNNNGNNAASNQLLLQVSRGISSSPRVRYSERLTPILARINNDSDVEIFKDIMALSQLVQIMPNCTSKLVSLLLQASKNSDPKVRSVAVKALIEMAQTMPEFNDKTVYLLPQISSHLNFPFIKWIWNILGKWMWGELSSSNTMTTLANIVTYNDLTNQLFNGLIRSLPISILLNKAITQFEEEYKQSKKLDQTALCILWGIVVRQLSVQKPLYLTPTSAGLQVNLYFSDAEAPLVISVESAAYLELLIKMISERLQRSRYNLKCVPVNFWGDLDFNSLAKEFYAKSAKSKSDFCKRFDIQEEINQSNNLQKEIPEEPIVESPPKRLGATPKSQRYSDATAVIQQSAVFNKPGKPKEAHSESEAPQKGFS